MNEERERSRRPTCARQLLRRHRDGLEAVLRRHGVPLAAAPPLVYEALLAAVPEAAAEFSAGRLLRALDVVCARWAAAPAARRAQGSTAAAGDGFDALLQAVAYRLEARHERFAEEAEAAPALVAELLALPAERRSAALAERRFHSRAVVERLLAAADREASGRPRRALGLALLAGEVAARLEATEYGAAALRDLRARTAMKCGNARRILADLDAAEADFDRAERWLEEGSLAPRLRAEFLRLRAAVHRARRQLDDAERLLDQAMAIHRWAGEREQQVKVLVSRSLLAEHRGDYETGVEICEQARGLLAGKEESRLHMAVLHNLAFHLLRLERAGEAALLLPEVERLATAHGGANDRLRVDWLRGLVEAAHGDPAGERRLCGVRQGFIDAAQPFGAALVSLDLAALYLAAGRTAATRRLADEMVPLFRSMRVHREALAAVLVFRQAAELERATVGLTQEVARSLRHWQERAAAASPS